MITSIRLDPVELQASHLPVKSRLTDETGCSHCSSQRRWRMLLGPCPCTDKRGGSICVPDPERSTKLAQVHSPCKYRPRIVMLQNMVMLHVRVRRFFLVCFIVCNVLCTRYLPTNSGNVGQSEPAPHKPEMMELSATCSVHFNTPKHHYSIIIILIE
jgi:hypothetical protein